MMGVVASGELLQQTYLRLLGSCRSWNHVTALVRRAQEHGHLKQLNDITLASACQAAAQYEGNSVSDTYRVLRDEMMSRIGRPMSSPAAAKFLQAHRLFHSSSPWLPFMIDAFRADMAQCSLGAIVGASTALSSPALSITFDPLLWTEIIDRLHVPIADGSLSLSQLSRVSGSYARMRTHILLPDLIGASFIAISNRVAASSATELSVGRLAELLWGMGVSGVIPRQWANTALSERLIVDLPEIPSRLLTQITLSLAHSSICPAPLFSAIEQQLPRTLPGMSRQSLSNMAWSLAVARRPGLLGDIWARLPHDINSLTVPELAQLHQSFLWARTLPGPDITAQRDLDAISSLARDAFFALRPQAPSELQESVTEAALMVWPDAIIEKQCSRTGYWVDFVLPKEQKAFEVNGPHHYCRLLQRLRGPSLLKANTLVGHGWTSFRHVPYFEWTFGGSNHEAQCHYLQVLAMGK